MVGILGRTGSGKSTLVDLLLRVYNVELDTLYIDSHDIITIPLKQLRDTIGYVPQDNFLFSDTIKANIGFSQAEIDIEKVVDAAKLSDVYTNIIEFKEGFDTILGERGVTVSGGQKQRISIARALTKDPKVLILDDSVSAVDTKTEEAIIKNLSQVRKNKTTIFIAHRISTVRHMDKILLLDDGKLVGNGSHEELLKVSPLYQEMVRLQTLDRLEDEKGGDLDA
jgi:ATP-binding cassette subfamily B protein